MARIAPAVLRSAVAIVVVSVALGIVACESRVPLPQLPQLQGLGELGEFGTERLRTNNACRSSSADVEAFVRCMQDQGWEFIPRGSVFPSPECWRQRDASDRASWPMAQCFQRTAAPRPAPAAGNP